MQVRQRAPGRANRMCRRATCTASKADTNARPGPLCTCARHGSLVSDASRACCTRPASQQSHDRGHLVADDGGLLQQVVWLGAGVQSEARRQGGQVTPPYNEAHDFFPHVPDTPSWVSFCASKFKMSRASPLPASLEIALTRAAFSLARVKSTSPCPRKRRRPCPPRHTQPARPRPCPCPRPRGVAPCTR